MIDTTTYTPPDARPNLKEVAETAWLPALLAMATAVATWIIWYYTTMPCPAELSSLTGCNPSGIARYIDVDIYGPMITYAAISSAAGGVWYYTMFSRMRAMLAAERQRAEELEKLVGQYRLEADEQRRQVDEQRREADEQRWRAEEQRQQQWQDLLANFTVERQQAAQDRQAFLSVLSDVTAELARLREQRNGNGNGHEQRDR